MQAPHRMETGASAALGHPSRRLPKLGLAACLPLAAACLLSVGCHGLTWLAPKEPDPPQTVSEFVGSPRVTPSTHADQ